MQADAAKKRFTVDEFYKMAQIGILTDSAPSELIDGEIIEVSPIGPAHRAAVNRASDCLIPLFKGKAHISVQLPVRLNEFNEPEPDLAFLKPRRDFYKSRHPGPADVFLIFEISDSSLRYDHEVKLPMYAASRIPEVWIEDVNMGVLHVFRDPARKSYQTARILRPGSTISLPAFPDVPVSVSELLGVSE